MKRRAIGATWGKNSTRPESSRKFKNLEKDPLLLVETWYNLKFLEFSVFMCFRRVFTLRCNSPPSGWTAREQSRILSAFGPETSNYENIGGIRGRS